MSAVDVVHYLALFGLALVCVAELALISHLWAENDWLKEKIKDLQRRLEKPRLPVISYTPKPEATHENDQRASRRD